MLILQKKTQIYAESTEAGPEQQQYAKEFLSLVTKLDEQLQLLFNYSAIGQKDKATEMAFGDVTETTERMSELVSLMTENEEVNLENNLVIGEHAY